MMGLLQLNLLAWAVSVDLLVIGLTIGANSVNQSHTRLFWPETLLALPSILIVIGCVSACDRFEGMFLPQQHLLVPLLIGVVGYTMLVSSTEQGRGAVPQPQLWPMLPLGCATGVDAGTVATACHWNGAAAVMIAVIFSLSTIVFTIAGITLGRWWSLAEDKTWSEFSGYVLLLWSSLHLILRG